MNPDSLIVICLLAAAVLLFAFEWIPQEITAIITVVVLISTGILTPQEGLSGFSSNAVIAIGALLIIGAGLVRSGAVKWLSEKLAAVTCRGAGSLLLVSTVVPGLLSGFINIVAAVSIFIPAVLRLARRSRYRASILLLPMAVSGLMGANLSLIGASHNLVANGLMKQETGESFGFFEFTPVGIILLGGVIIYSLFFAKLLLSRKKEDSSGEPEDKIEDLVFTYHLNEQLWEVLVHSDSPLCCKTLEDIGLGSKYGLGVLMVLRKNRQMPIENKDFYIQENDVLALSGNRENLDLLIRDYPGLVLMGHLEARKDFTWSIFDLAEVIVTPHSGLIGKTLRDTDLRHRWGVTGIAMWREHIPVKTDVRDVPLEAGDGILIFGSRNHIREFKPEQEGYLWLNKPREQEAPLAFRRYAPAAVTIFLGVIAVSAFDLMPIAVAALAGAALMNILGIMNPVETYKSIDWRTLILIAGMYPIGMALQKTGAAFEIAELIINSAGTWGKLPALAVVGILSMILTQPMHNAVAALIMTPVAIQVATVMNSNPRAFVIAVIAGASASFIMPVGHPAPLLVQKPGHYKNIDYLKFGSGAALFVLLVIPIVIPVFFPL